MKICVVTVNADKTIVIATILVVRLPS